MDVDALRETLAQVALAQVEGVVKEQLDGPVSRIREQLDTTARDIATVEGRTRLAMVRIGGEVAQMRDSHLQELRVAAAAVANSQLRRVHAEGRRMCARAGGRLRSLHARFEGNADRTIDELRVSARTEVDRMRGAALDELAVVKADTIAAVHGDRDRIHADIAAHVRRETEAANRRMLESTTELHTRHERAMENAHRQLHLTHDNLQRTTEARITAHLDNRFETKCVELNDILRRAGALIEEMRLRVTGADAATFVRRARGCAGHGGRDGDGRRCLWCVYARVRLRAHTLYHDGRAAAVRRRVHAEQLRHGGGKEAR